MNGRVLRHLVIAGLAVVTVFVLFDLFTPMHAPVGGGGGPLPGTKRLAMGAMKQGAQSHDLLRSQILEKEEIARAFALRPEDLPILGLVLYGSSRNASKLEEEYRRVAQKRTCSHRGGDASNRDCNAFTPRRLPRIEDGALTRSLFGTIVLHRFTSNADNPNTNLTYRRLYVADRSLQMIEDPIYDFDSGVDY